MISTEKSEKAWYDSIGRSIAIKIAHKYGNSVAKNALPYALETHVFDEAPYYKRTLKAKQQEQLVDVVRIFLKRY